MGLLSRLFGRPRVPITALTAPSPCPGDAGCSGAPTPAEIAGQRGWGHAPNPVGITSSISHQHRGLTL
jgi:hypothetical protein